MSEGVARFGGVETASVSGPAADDVSEGVVRFGGVETLDQIRSTALVIV